MFRTTENFYADWRAKTCGTNFLRDDRFPSERLLQAVWQHQRLDRHGLKTVDGKTVRVFHPGFASVEGGPDFRDAVIQIGDDAPRSGDIEIDLLANGWRAHGHDRNVHFKNVILHVVWHETKTNANGPAILPLENVLDAPLTELDLSLDGSSLRLLPESQRGKCCAPLRELDDAQRTELLCAAARVRFENKAAQIRARAKNAGWEQALWENLFRALGYKHNIWPMHALAETRTRWSRGIRSAFEFQARLLGISGLLPTDPARLRRNVRKADAAKPEPVETYLRELWDLWWREREEFSDQIIPPTAWRFHGLRPANHPQRRLALAAHWLTDKQLIARIEKWSATEFTASRTGRPASPANKKTLKALEEILQVSRDDFWSWQWTFRSTRLKKPQPLLGEARLTDLAVNVILPWLWVRAKEGRNESLQREMERRYFTWPAAEDNATLKLARQRLLGTSNAKAFKTAAAQQGLLQIVRDFCEHSNAVCDHCPFPDSVRGWNEKHLR